MFTLEKGMISKISASCSLYVIALLAVCVMLAAAPALAQSPVGYWPFDDGSGTKATDASGNGHTATLVNGVTWVPGKIGGAVSANAAASQYVSIPAVDLSGTHAVTIALWSKRTYSTAGGHTLFEAAPNFMQSATGFGFFPDDSTCLGIQAAINGDVGETANCYNQPSSGAWHHLAIVYDKTQTGGNQVALYIDGALQNPTRSLYASTNTNIFGNNPIYLFTRGGSADFDTGMLADFRIYNSALTAEQIQQIYSSAGLVSLSVTPASASITVGSQQRFTAMGTYRDGSKRDLTNSVAWTSTVPSVATTGSGGFLTGVATGNTTVKATLARSSGVAGVKVTAPGSSRDATSKPGILATSTPGSTGIKLDGTVHGVHDNGSSASNTAAVSIGTPTAGDLITCEVTFDGHNANALVSVSDNNNGSYVAAIPAHLNTTLIQWFGIYYAQNVVGSPTTVTLKTSQSNQWAAISCQAWTGVATSNSLDSGFLQSRDALSTPNPTTGANKTPAGNGELIIAGLGLYSSGTPTAGANYALIDSASASQWWPEYWIQTAATATAGNFIRGSDNFTDMMAAFRPAAVASTFTIAASPASLTLVQGHQGTSTITTVGSGGFSNAITLSATGVPSGATVSFSPNPIPAPGTGSSTMTITVGSSTALGTYAMTVTGNGGGVQQSASVTLTVTSAGNFTIAASPSSVSVAQGSHGTSTITTAISGGFSNPITLSASGVPSGTTVSFSPSPIAAPGAGTSTMTISVGSSTPTGTYSITVTGNGGSIHQSTTMTLTVTAAPNFTIAASPASLSVIQGNHGSSTITTTVSGGFSNPITLSASGVPSGTTVSFSPNPIAAPGAGTSTTTISVGSSTPTGTYSITVTGNGGGIQQSTTMTLTVTAQLALSWNASTSSGVTGYNAYRSPTAGGPYTKLNSSPIPSTSYADQTVQGGYTYYYVTTAVNSQGVESVYSNQAVATVP